MSRELDVIKKLTNADFEMRAFQVSRWNYDLSPWEADAVFGNENFGAGAADTLQEILKFTEDTDKTYYIGGYSLAGLFALWASCQSDIFQGIAAASPSIWFPGFTDYMQAHGIKARSVYLSLGDKESKTRNPIMAKAGEKIEEAHQILRAQGIPCTLEWNPGNHFKEPELRTAKAFAWCMQQNQHSDY